MAARFTYRWFLILLITLGCVEPFTPTVSNYADLLVVEAFITDEPSSHFVKLSRSYPINTRLVSPETGATITLTSASGLEQQFLESGPGHYEFTTGFNPIIGESYVLNIVTGNGANFVSDPVVMKETQPIEDLYYDQKTLPTSNTAELDLGYQIYANSAPGNQEKVYMKYEWEDTWEFATPYESFLDFDFETNTAFLREENISVCWRGDNSVDIRLASNADRNSANIQGQPIKFVSFGEATLRIKYSILVKQFALSEESYQFWKDLKDSNESAGTLYDSQPFQVTSNIINIQDNNLPVLGYFEMTSEASKRLFITKDDLPHNIYIPTYYPECLSGADTVVSLADTPEFLNGGYLIETTIPPPISGFTIVLERCIDCRQRGTNKKPEFWD